MTTTTVANRLQELHLREWHQARIPGGYSPFPYRLGDICDQCWLDWCIITAVGVDGCYHK